VTDATVAAIAQRRPSSTAAATGVKSLELAESDITDAALFDLARGCRWLEELSLRRCLNITDAGVAALAQGCPHIKTLEYDIACFSMITGAFLTHSDHRSACGSAVG
jgi:hypothetical protein